MTRMTRLFGKRTLVKSIVLLFLFIVVSVYIACKKEHAAIPDNNTGLTPYSISYPIFFPVLALPAGNPMTLEGISLGRQLYYDTIMSNDGRACASCHMQAESFSKSSVNSLTHVNLGWSKTFLWKGGVEGTLEDAMYFEVTEFFKTNIARLNQQPGYRAQFRKVFGADSITPRLAANAMAQFVRSVTSFNSRVDRYMRHEIILSFEELNGLYIYNSEKGECFHCHSLGLYHDNTYHNTGLDSVYTSLNRGRFDVTGNTEDIGKFKTPTLRNIAITAPYMHDGRFATLEEVIEFYNSGVNHPPNLDPIMTKPSFAHGLQLTAQQKSDLLAFLRALTDSTFLSNPAYAHP